MEVMTILSSEDDPDDPGVEVPVQPAADVSESSGDEGGNDLDKGEPEEGDPQTGDPIVDPEDAPDLEDESEDKDEFTQMWIRLGLQPDKGQVDVVRRNWRKIESQIEVIWQDLRQVIVDAFRSHGRITCSREEHYLKEELALVTHMSLLMERRLELLQSFDTEVDLRAEYLSPEYK